MGEHQDGFNGGPGRRNCVWEEFGKKRYAPGVYLCFALGWREKSECCVPLGSRAPSDTISFSISHSGSNVERECMIKMMNGV